MELHEQIKKERLYKKLSKYKVAQLINSSESYYNEMEQGRQHISRKYIEKMCEALSISITIHPDNTTTIKRVKSK